MFQRKNRGVQVTVGISGTGGGFERFCRGEIDLSNASRPIRGGAARCRSARRTCAGRRSRSPTTASRSSRTRSATWANCLTTAELKKIWDTGLEGRQLEGRARRLPRRAAEAVRARHRLGHVRVLHREDQRPGASRAAATTRATEDDNVLVQGVSGERGGLGYFGLSYYVENKDRLKLLGRRRRRLRRAEHRTVQSYRYKPLSRPLFIYAKRDSFRRGRGGARSSASSSTTSGRSRSGPTWSRSPTSSSRRREPSTGALKQVFS